MTAPLYAPEGAVAVLQYASADALTDALHAINDGGVDPTLAGVTAGGQPFIAMLRGAYADDHVVLFNTPWDGEVCFPSYICDDCGAGAPSTFTDLEFPVTVLQGFPSA